MAYKGYHIIILTILTMLLSNDQAHGQDVFTGSWEMIYKPGNVRSPMTVTLQVASPEKGILYPALLTLDHEQFKGSYQLLLVRKNAREIAISKTKHPVSEMPFSLGNRTITLNGSFDLSRDYRENTHYLTSIRIPVIKFPIPFTDDQNLDPANKELSQWLYRFFSDAELRLKKISSSPWESPDASIILDPAKSPAYFGIKDSVFLSRKDGTIVYPRTRKMDNDSVTLSLNGKIFADQIALHKKKEPDDIILDTGVNILVTFAENFGKNPMQQGKVQVDFAYKQWMIDFNSTEDLAAGFIVSRLIFEEDEVNNTRFSAYFDSLPPEKIMDRTSKLLGNLVSTSHEITLALWDDAVEDGDSISLNINGQWIARDFPVLKRPQFIKVSLKPGPNSITFVANNLGSIPPNTAVLEIIDGRKRKSFMIDTDLDKNNLVRIFYDFRPAD